MSPPISARQSPVWHRPLRYLPGFLIPALATISLLLPGFWAWLTVIVTFGFFPAIELFRAGSPDNLDPAEEAAARQNRGYVILLYAMVPIQYGLLATYLVRIANHQYQDLFTLTGATFAMGIACGVLGINVAHDLGHRRRRSEQALAKALLLTSLYLHFFIEHNRGHHALVGTDEDPASARYGESLFRFLPRTLVGSLISAWQLERDRLAKRGQGPVTWKNQLIRFLVVEIAAVAGVAVGLGPEAALAFIGVAGIGAALLETVNYVEHYGLRRERTRDGRPGKVLPIHSWNSNHPIGRTVLFELTRHSDHHANAQRPYQVLRHYDESPELPTGYPGMMVLAWCPPLWFRVMHRHIDRIGALDTPADRDPSPSGPR